MICRNFKNAILIEWDKLVDAVGNAALSKVQLEGKVYLGGVNTLNLKYYTNFASGYKIANIGNQMYCEDIWMVKFWFPPQVIADIPDSNVSLWSERDTIASAAWNQSINVIMSDWKAGALS